MPKMSLFQIPIYKDLTLEICIIDNILHPKVINKKHIWQFAAFIKMSLNN